MTWMQRLITSTGERNLYSYLDIIYANERVSIFANLTSMMILGVLYQGTVSPWVLWPWVSVWLLNSAVQYRARPVYKVNSGYSLSQKISVYLAIGTVNCLCVGGSSLLFANSSLEHGFYIQALFISFYFTGVFTANAYVWPFYLASTATIVLPMVVVSLFIDAPHATAIGIGLAVMWVLVSLYAHRYAHIFGESIRLQHEKSTLADALLVEKQRVDRAHQAQRFFLSAISHDLKQPLYAMRLLTDTARESQTNLPQIADAMDRTLNDLDELFSSILQIGSIEAEQVEVEKHEFAMGDLLDSIFSTYNVIAAEHNLKLKVHSPPNIQLNTDRLLLERIIANLVSNGIRYTDSGSIWVGWRPQRRRIEVRDSGRGIPEDQLQRIFEAFTQIAPSTAGDKGTGLGLAICQRLCKLLDIKITVQSTLGRGSVFSLHLPASMLLPSAAKDGEPDSAVLPETKPITADRADEYTV